MDLHFYLKAAREREGVTAVQMAAYLGVSEDQIRRYDSGRTEISLSQAARYAQALGKQLGDVLPSTQIRANDLQPFVMALQGFDERERPEMIREAADRLAFVQRVVSSRIAPRASDIDDKNGAPVHNSRPLQQPAVMSRLTETLAGVPAGSRQDNGTKEGHDPALGSGRKRKDSPK